MRPYLYIGLVLLAAVCGCKKVAQPTDGTTSPTFPVDDRNTNYRPGAGALKNTVQAGKRTAAMHDYEQLKTIVFAMELENNRMPTKEEIRTELTGNGQNLLTLIDKGAIIMPDKPMKDGVWYYEVDAEKVGGIVVYKGNVTRATAEDMKKYLGQ
jgi:hypothetical protein